MSKHNFKALQTFRGWSIVDDKFVYGSYIDGFILEHYLIGTQSINGREHKTFYTHNVKKESIGIYTGKDDKNGMPIFAGLPEDGNIGCDIVTMYFDSTYKAWEYSVKHKGTKVITVPKVGGPLGNRDLFPMLGKLEVIGTEYERYIKETK